MKKIIYRAFGILLILGALVGSLLSLTGIGAVWYYRPKIDAQLANTVASIDRTLESTDSMLDSIDNSLETVQTNLTSLEEISSEIASSLNDITPVIDDVATLVGEDLVLVLEDTQTSLASLQGSAELVDDALGLLASIPLLGLDYQPDVPLGISIGQLSNTLDPLPDQFVDLQDGLDTTSENIHALQTQARELASDIAEFNTSMDDLRLSIDAYQLTLDQIKIDVARGYVRIDKTILVLSIALTMFFLWMMVAQVGLFFQGLTMLQGGVIDEIDRYLSRASTEES